MKQKFFSIARNVFPVVWIGFIFTLVLGAGAFYLHKNINLNKSGTADNTGTTAPSEENKNAVSESPPSYSATVGSIKKSVSTPQGLAVITSEGAITEADLSRLNYYAGAGAASNITYTDTTGRYPTLGTTLTSYISSKLLSTSSDRSYMYEIRVVDCADCNYAGLYTGTYLVNGGRITKAFGWITLNALPYKDNAHFTDYMKLILSHEYGHHYSLYHRWMDLQIPAGERFPAAYYGIRPLSYSDTAADYSLGWANCDSEIVAEDYSYLFSGYGQDAMAAARGYPSAATADWFRSLSGLVATPQPQPATDTVAPSVAITSPANGATLSGSVVVSANASDNVGITKVEFYIDGNLLATDASAPYSTSWNTTNSSNSDHTILAKAYDANQSSASNVAVTVNNQVTDSINPVVTINQPATDPYSWSVNDLVVEATGSDNVGVVKMEFYINNSLAATENSGHIIRLWKFTGTPIGTYTLKAKAYDAAGNSGEISVIVNKQAS